jgi:hypothetical protein
LILRTLVTGLTVAGLVALCMVAEAQPPSRKSQEAPNTPAAREQPGPKTKPKPRRVIIFGTTIVGDVLKPTTDKTVPWQRPAAFREGVDPLDHDFTIELLTPLNRDAILQDAGEHGH